MAACSSFMCLFHSSASLSPSVIGTMGLSVCNSLRSLDRRLMIALASSAPACKEIITNIVTACLNLKENKCQCMIHCMEGVSNSSRSSDAFVVYYNTYLSKFLLKIWDGPAQYVDGFSQDHRLSIFHCWIGKVTVL